MSYESEAQLENSLIDQLDAMGWKKASITDEKSLFSNLKKQLEIHNKTSFSDQEFEKIKNHLDKGNVFDKSKLLRDKFNLLRDDGSNTHIEFFNSQHWCRNQYQVTNQIKLNGKRKNRYDVTLLINGLPLGQIELKKRGESIKEAFNQINRYHRDSYPYGGGLFQYIQIFIISNGVNTKYFSNNERQNFKQTFEWTDEDNNRINALNEFADVFFEKCHFSKMIAKYIVLHETDKIPMVLRPYQYYAVEAITKRVKETKENGYIWHTTGSGKTLTSFKAAQNIIELPKIDKVLFVVDRADLDDQTIREFSAFKKDCVDHTTNTKSLVEQLVDPNSKLIVTTIQKLNNAISNNRHQSDVERLKDKRIVFIFDECHRSQFGDTHRRIRDFFSNAQMFGFTGTPIFADNAVGKRTTKELFSECLHKYIITNAINDQNVLKFGIEYLGDKECLEEHDKAFFDHPDRIESIVDWVIANHDKKTHHREFGAIMCVSSVDALVTYWDIFERRRLAGEHNLKIASIFTYSANEDDPNADGTIPETQFPSDNHLAENLPKRDKLARIVEHYNAMYGTKESVLDGKSFYNYFRAIANRVKRRDKAGFLKEDGIDILLVVNMFLTGFDAKKVNTLYVDKNLKYHGLIQAFSRTNRTLGDRKSQGNIVCFRNLKEATDEALMLFANKDAKEVVIIGSYQEHLAKYNEAVEKLKLHTPDFESVDRLFGETEDATFINNFRDIIRARNVLSTFSEFDIDNLELSEQEYNNFKSKYLDLATKYKNPDEHGEYSPLRELDFELELLQADEINVDYLLNLIRAVNLSDVTNRVVREDKLISLKNKIIKQLNLDLELRKKIPLVEEFFHYDHSRILDDSEHIMDFWYEFLDAKKKSLYDNLIQAENLKSEEFYKLIRHMDFTSKEPIESEIIAALNYEVKLLQRVDVSNRIKKELEFIRSI